LFILAVILNKIKEVNDMCVEEEKQKAGEINRFAGFRVMQVTIKNAAV
jgi:hypothetical protein